MRSAPLPHPPLARVIGAAGLLWLAPLPLGGALMGFAPVLPTGATLWAQAIGTALLLSPLLSWLGWLMALPGLWWLLRAGLFGWLPAVAFGLATGLAAGGLLDLAAAPPLGMAALLALRALLPRFVPELRAALAA